MPGSLWVKSVVPKGFLAYPPSESVKSSHPTTPPHDYYQSLTIIGKATDKNHSHWTKLILSEAKNP